MNSLATSPVAEGLDGRDALDAEARAPAAGSRRRRPSPARPCRRGRVAAASSAGVSWRQGPHHSAQKSTTTGSSRERSTHARRRSRPRRRRRSPGWLPTSLLIDASTVSTTHRSLGRPRRRPVRRAPRCAITFVHALHDLADDRIVGRQAGVGARSRRRTGCRRCRADRSPPWPSRRRRGCTSAPAGGLSTVDVAGAAGAVGASGRRPGSRSPGTMRWKVGVVVEAVAHELGERGRGVRRLLLVEADREAAAAGRRASTS